jgi:hypothetical protein
MSKDLINQVGKVTKSNDPFYDSRLLFKLAEYYDGSLEEWYKPKLPKPSSNQIANSDKVIKSSATFLGGKRNGYAYQNSLYEWGAKKIDKVLDLPLGTFKGIQRDIAKTLPTGISLDEVFGVKSSGRYSPIEGILTNPLETKVNRGKGSFVDNLKSFYQKKLIDASEDPKKQKEILKEYNDSVKKAKVRDPSLKDVELPNYKVGVPPKETIKGFYKLPLSIQNKLLENYEKTNISPVTKKATSIFDVAKAIKSKTFGKLDEGVQASLSNISSNQEKKILGDLNKLIASLSDNPACAVFAGKRGKFDVGGSPNANIDDCLQGGIKVINSGKIPPNKASQFANFTKKASTLGGNIMKIGIIPEAIYVAADGLIRMGLGDTFKEAGLRASEYLLPGDQTKEADMLKVERTLGAKAAKIVGRAIDYRNQLSKIDFLKRILLQIFNSYINIYLRSEERIL